MLIQAPRDLLALVPSVWLHNSATHKLEVTEPNPHGAFDRPPIVLA